MFILNWHFHVSQLISTNFLKSNFLFICSFVPVGNVNESNMAVMEVSFPSGFTADLDTLPSVVSSNSIKRYETKNADTVAILYFDSITLKELCPTINAYRTHKVAKQKPAAVKIYDYYDNCKYIHIISWLY